MGLVLSAEAPDAVERAAAVLGEGGLVALPTETVYGLAGDAADGAAVARIFEAKGRPRFNPLIAHVCDLAMAERLVRMDALARRLAERFWPGPLTLVLPAREGAGVHPLVCGGLPTLAVRLPRGIAGDVVAALGRPVAAPSANRSGRVSPTAAAHVVRSLGARVDLVLDGGPAAVGLESTIVRPGEGGLVLLRAGGIGIAELEEAAGMPVRRADPNAAIEAPGQLLSHYAPFGTLRLDATSVEPGEWLVRFGPDPVAGEERAAGCSVLSASGDLVEAAARLFAVLTDLDRPDVPRIAVMPIPEDGLGLAINDRLARAAAPRG